MEIRKAEEGDLDRVLAIYATARETMRKNGNPHQWGTEKPLVYEVVGEIEKGHLMLAAEGEEIFGVFAMIPGRDPTYTVIDGGAWLNDEPYITLHKVASDGRRSGIVRAAVEYALRFTDNVRADTHADNRLMQRALTSLGFAYCGIIYLSDGDPRRAYQLVKG